MKLKHTAEQTVRNLLKELCSRSEEQINENQYRFRGEEFMDDGSNIDLEVTINKSDVITLLL